MVYNNVRVRVCTTVHTTILDTLVLLILNINYIYQFIFKVSYTKDVTNEYNFLEKEHSETEFNQLTGLYCLYGVNFGYETYYNCFLRTFISLISFYFPNEKM